jgi:anti-sigma-K factor RskA
MTLYDRDPARVPAPEAPEDSGIPASPPRRRGWDDSIGYWIVAIGAVTIVALVMYGITRPPSSQTAASPPAATVAPAPTTTGQGPSKQ